PATTSGATAHFTLSASTGERAGVRCRPPARQPNRPPTHRVHPSTRTFHTGYWILVFGSCELGTCTPFFPFFRPCHESPGPEKAPGPQPIQERPHASPSPPRSGRGPG